MPLDPVYFDPFHKPRKASRLDRLRRRLRYRVWAWLDGYVALGEAEVSLPDRPPSRGRVSFQSPKARRSRRLLLALALAMAGCGTGVAAWVVWGGG